MTRCAPHAAGQLQVMAISVWAGANCCTLPLLPSRACYVHLFCMRGRLSQWWVRCHFADSLAPLCLQDLEQDAELVRVGTQAHQDSILLEAQLHGLQQGQERETQMLQAAEHNAQGLRDEHELHASQVGGPAFCKAHVLPVGKDKVRGGSTVLSYMPARRDLPEQGAGAVGCQQGPMTVCQQNIGTAGC